MHLFLALLMVVAMSGCSIGPTQQELRNADYGKPPSNHEEIIRNYMNQRLKDPDSAKYSFKKGPVQGWNSFGGLLFGYIVCADINAKNSYGGYTGRQPYYFIIKNDTVVRTADQAMAETWCQKL